MLAEAAQSAPYQLHPACRARLDRILRGESSMSATDLQRICDALGLAPWKVVLAAETGRTYEEVVADLDDTPTV